MRIIRSTDSRRTETPAAVMTTLASPGQGGAANPVWRVDAADVAGPVHVIDAEQVWTVLAGTVAVTIGDDRTELGAGDTVVVPGDLPRQFTPGADGFAAVVTGPAGMRAYMPGSPDKKIDLAWAA
jgi:mannose-6-phosphate isomerase-like protein (cupin superfamily)